MGTIRFFSGGRDANEKKSVASEIMRLEILKNGKMPSADRYKFIMKKRLNQYKQEALTNKNPLKGMGSMPKSLKEARQMSARAEQALKEIAMKKAAKEAKALRKMVLITPRTYPTGQLTQKGKIYDVAGNVVGEVNRKNGKMTAANGWSLGKYKGKSYMTDLTIQDTIQKYSPYYIQQRKLQQMQQAQGGVWGANNESFSMFGYNPPPSHESSQASTFNGFESMGPRQNIGMTSWGAMSDNVWGTYADNAWGNSMDNVWGMNSTDVWGGIGVGGMWGGKGIHVWGTGSGKNYIRSLTSKVAAFFGLKVGKGGAHEAFKAVRSERLSARTGGSRGSSTRTTGRSGGH